MSRQRNVNAESLGLLFRFGLSGILATATYTALVAAFGLLTAWPPMAIHVVGFVLALPVSYLLQRNFTFRDTQSVGRSFPRFAATAATAFALSTATIHVGIDVLGLPPVPTFAVAVAMIAGGSFLAMRFWAFVS